MGAIFRTEREKFRFCQKSLILDGKSNVVVVHHSEFRLTWAVEYQKDVKVVRYSNFTDIIRWKECDTWTTTF